MTSSPIPSRAGTELDDFKQKVFEASITMNITPQGRDYFGDLHRKLSSKVGTNKRGKPIMFYDGREIFGTSEFVNALKRSDKVIHTKSDTIFPNLLSTPIYQVKERVIRHKINQGHPSKPKSGK